MKPKAINPKETTRSESCKIVEEKRQIIKQLINTEVEE